jgi:hypothetical protein
VRGGSAGQGYRWEEMNGVGWLPVTGTGEDGQKQAALGFEKPERGRGESAYLSGRCRHRCWAIAFSRGPSASDHGWRSISRIRPPVINCIHPKIWDMIRVGSCRRETWCHLSGHATTNTSWNHPLLSIAGVFWKHWCKAYYYIQVYN